MKKALRLFLILFLFTTTAGADVKKADLAGTWYSSNEDVLKNELESYLRYAQPPSFDERVIAIIAPHAGFVYSGAVAAFGYKVLSRQKNDIIVVVGFSHRRRYNGIALLNTEGVETPLGVLEIDRDVTNELLRADAKCIDYPRAFLGENSVEMQLPFIKLIAGDCKVVLIALGEQSFMNCRILGEVLYRVLRRRKNYCLIASTDMSHYLHHEHATDRDSETAALIEQYDPEALYDESERRGHRLMCGYGAVCATMIAAKMLGADKIEILKYMNSGDTTGNTDRVVGYLSAAMLQTRTLPFSKANITSRETVWQSEGDRGARMLNDDQRKRMLRLARETITLYLKKGKRLDAQVDDPVLKSEMGAFVTLHKHGRLRGCIGNLVGKGPFFATVREMAIEAATGDPRFPSVTAGELDDIDIEISALSPLQKIEDPEKIVVGKHGVLVKNMFTSGVYLPQVATETGWSREEFMNSLCGQKAGMAPDAWKKGTCDIYIFTAEVFGEKE